MLRGESSRRGPFKMTTLPAIKYDTAIVAKNTGRPTPQFLRFFNIDFRGAIQRQDEAQQVIINALQIVQDEQAALLAALQAQVERLTGQTIGTSFADGLTVTGVADGATASIVISAHTRTYTDEAKAIDAGIVSGLEYGKTYSVFYDDPDRIGGAVTYQVTLDPPQAVTSAAHPFRHLVGVAMTPATDLDPPTTGGGTRPPGWPPGDDYQTVDP